MKQSLILINWTPEGTLTAAMFVKLCGLVKISADITVKSGTLCSRLNFMPTNNLQNIFFYYCTVIELFKIMDSSSNQRQNLMQKLAEVSFRPACPSELQGKKGFYYQRNRHNNWTTNCVSNAREEEGDLNPLKAQGFQQNWSSQQVWIE